MEIKQLNLSQLKKVEKHVETLITEMKEVHTSPSPSQSQSPNFNPHPNTHMEKLTEPMTKGNYNDYEEEEEEEN